MSAKASGQGIILLVDHSRGALLFQESLLRRRQSVIISALAGSEGLEKARAERPELIMFGFDLFDMTAPEFCREIRNDADLKGTSLLFVCERDCPEEGEMVLSAGCNDVVVRPLQRAELDNKIARLTSIPSRRELRTITRLEVSLENEGRFVLGRSLNISATGMLLEVDKVMAEGRMRVHFYLPGDPKPMGIEAEVLRAEFTGTMSKYGVRFLDVDSEQRERIDRFVHRLNARERQ